jgi:hypothetical protein
VPAGPLRSGKMFHQHPDDEGRQPDGPASARVLGGPAISSPLTSVRVSATVTAPAARSTRAWAEPGQLADSQAAVGAHEHLRPVSAVDRLG